MRYSLLTKKGYFSFDEICFGRLCRLPMGMRGTLGISGERMTDADMINASLLSSLKGSDFVAIDFPVKLNESLWKDITQEQDTAKVYDIAIKEILSVLEALPMYKGMWVYQPEYKTLRVMCDKPYDQVMTLLFLVRNLAQKSNSRMYMKMRENGYSPLNSAAMAHLFWLEGGFGISSRGARVTTMTTDEYNWFNPQTLTHSDLVKLLKQEEFPVWFGEVWTESEYGGYKRDDHFEQHDIQFRADLVDTYNYDDDEDDDDEESYNDDCGNNGPYYRLVDVFSSSEAEFESPLSIQHNYLDGGFVLNGGWKSMEEFIESFDAFLTANGLAK